MRKLLQNSLFAAMTAWALYGLVNSVPDNLGTMSNSSSMSYSYSSSSSDWRR